VLSVSDWAELYVPAARLNVGVATVPVIVKTPAATALSAQVLLYAIALSVVSLLSGSGIAVE